MLGGGRPAYAGTGAALSQDGLIVCDASTNSRRPYEVYNTPIIVTDQASSMNRVAFWTERNIANINLGNALDRQGYFFARVEGNSDPTISPTCEVRSEEDFVVDGSILPSPTDDMDGDGIREGLDGSSSTATFMVGSNPSLYFPTMQGFVNRYDIGSDAWPDEATGSTHYSSQVTDSSADAGTDSTGFVDPERQLMIFGTRCNATNASGTHYDCDVDLTASPPREWGRLYLVDLTDPTSASALDTVDIEAWTFGAPVGLSTSSGDTADQLLVALGTLASTSATAPYFELNGTRDCSLVLVAVEDSSGSYKMTITDSFDDGVDCVPPAGDYIDAVPGFGGEPVPHSSNQFLSQRFFGQLYNMTWDNTTQLLTKDWDLQLTDSTGDCSAPVGIGISRAR